MAIEQKYEPLIHWNYFVSLEEHLETIIRFIEPVEKNFETYSTEIARLFLSVGSEIDVVLKEICKIIEPDKSPEKINEYRDIILPKKRYLSMGSVMIQNFGLIFKPWDNWTKSKNPDWWRCYNNVKHNRTSNFEDANLGNALNAMAGLYLAIKCYYTEKSGDKLTDLGFLHRTKLFSVY